MCTLLQITWLKCSLYWLQGHLAARPDCTATEIIQPVKIQENYFVYLGDKNCVYLGVVFEVL